MGRKMQIARVLRGAAAAGCAFLISAAAGAKTLEFGPDHPLKQPSLAAAVARDGDVIEVEPGTYVDCAVWVANGLTIVGRGAGVVITTKPCEGKALFVVRGPRYHHS